jgi:hypothetical protein
MVRKKPARKPPTKNIQDRRQAQLRKVWQGIFSFRTLQVVGSGAAIFAAAVGIIYLEDERQDRILAREIAAWALLRDASSGNLGRARALELLRSQNANLSGVNLRGASLSFMDLSDTFLGGANMEGASIEWTDLSKSFLTSRRASRDRIFSGSFSRMPN